MEVIRDSLLSFLEGYVMLRGNPHFGSVRLK
nr:MAG TPA: hypothetical protein [Caudoviricetes sp.]